MELLRRSDGPVRLVPSVPVLPGTGAADEVGAGAGEGFTVNLPLAAGATDADYERVYDAIGWPVLRQFRPELILVSAGFDAYVDDPLGGMRLSAAGFGRLTAAVAAIADECCDGRVVAITEGGYDLKGLAACLRAAIRALEGETVFGPADAADATPRAAATIAAVAPRLSRFWTL
jgi:acetoin utilization deacetylase AcuC-like enzyme